MVNVVEVKTRRQIKQFVDYPNKLYKDVPQFLPSVYSDSLNTINPRKNHAFDFCEAKFWLAKRDGKIVGRIAAIINYKANEKWHKNQLRFWNVDFIDDAEVSKALFDEVEEWAKQKACDEIVGPLGFTDLDLEGMLVDGFDEIGVFCTYYNHPYYIEHLKNLGFEKDVDWVEYKMEIPKNKEELYTLSRMAEFSKRVYKLHTVEYKFGQDFVSAVPDFTKLLNLSYDNLYSTSELSNEQGADLFKNFKPVLNPKTSIWVYNESDELVGFIAAIADISKALKKSKGKLFPFGWARILKAVKSSDEYIALLVGVRPDYQAKGVICVLLDGLIEGFQSVGAKICRICPMLEDNNSVLSLMNIIPSKPYKRRRSFIKRL